MALTKTQVSMLYVAIFNRASEGEGNKYWQTNQPDMASTANAMLNTPDAKAYFGSSLDADQAFIELIYKNTLNKTYSDDKDGIDYWVKELANGKSRGEVVAALVNAVADYKDSTDATTKAAYDQFMNRVTVSDYTADKMEKAPTDYKTSLGFDGNLTVTNDASTVTSAESKIDDVVQTTNAKVLTPQPDNFHGTIGDDLFNGSVVQNEKNGTNVNTFTSEDKIDGGTGNDTLIIQHSNDNGNSISGYVSNVENINFTAFVDTSYDMSNTTGVKDFLNQNSVANLQVSHANAMNVGIKNVNKNTEITFDSTVYTTTTDSTTLTLENVTGQADIELNGNTIETLNIVSKTANNKIDLGGTALNETTKLVITGDKDLSMDNTDDDTDGTGSDVATPMNKITTVDASAFTGDLDLDLRNGNGTNKVNITGGTGDDRVILDDFTKDDVIDLGEGKDSLAIELTANVSTAASLNNIENIAFATNGNYSVNLEKAGAVEQLFFENGNDTLSVKKVATSAKTVNFVNHDNTGTDTFDSVNFALIDDDAKDNALTLNFASIKTNSNPVPAPMDDDATLTLGTFQANGIENITINTQNLGKDDKDTSNNTRKDTTFITGQTIDFADGGLKITTLTDEDLLNLTVKSDTYVEVTNTLKDTLKTVDASEASGGVKLDLSSAADSTSTSNNAVTVTTGSGVDGLKVNGDVSLTVKSNAGDDTISLTADTGHTDANDNNKTGKLGDKAKISINAGDGADTVDIHTIENLNNGSIKVILGDGVDTIKLNGDAKYSITVKDFVAGTGGDKIDFDTNATVTATKFDNDGTTNSSTVGLLVIKGDVTQGASATVAQIDAVQDIDPATNFDTAGDKMYVAYDDGSDTYIALITEVGDDGAGAGTDTITVIAELSGLSDATKLTVDNFADFLA